MKFLVRILLVYRIAGSYRDDFILNIENEIEFKNNDISKLVILLDIFSEGHAVGVLRVDCIKCSKTKYVIYSSDVEVSEYDCDCNLNSKEEL